jgi:hypothetical protein
MFKCSKCGSGHVRRIHRTLLERLNFLAVYECRECRAQESVPRRFQFRFGPTCRCPRCGTTQVSKLRGRDHIDAMASGPLNLVARLAGGGLYHCCFCRVQFYDRRPLAPPIVVTPVEAPAAPQPGTASSME